jgi:hypothetical protein
MEKKGQISFKVVFSFIIGLVVLFAILYFFSSVREVSEKQATIEIINLKTSIETRILQQSVRPEGSIANVSFSVPSAVEKVCFFDGNKKFDRLRNPDITGFYSDDKVNNLFILADEGFFHYSIKNLVLSKDKNPLCTKVIDNKVTLQLTSSQQMVKVDANQQTEDISCVSVFENGVPEKKIDIVFLGYGFDDIAEYNEHINRYVNNILLEFDPFSKFRDKFNFYRIDDASVECEVKDFIVCDQYEIKEAASSCPNDYIILLVARNAIEDLVRPVRSSAIGNIAKINTADKPFVVVHELGHSFGDLADEYVDEGYYSDYNFYADAYANCDSSPCVSWQNIENTSCYQGCSLGKYFRPTKDSIMRSLSSATFGPVNEKELLKRLLYYE